MGSTVETKPDLAKIFQTQRVQGQQTAQTELSLAIATSI